MLSPQSALVSARCARFDNGGLLAAALVVFGASTALFALSMRAPYAIALGAGAMACIFIGARALAYGQGAFLESPVDKRRLVLCLVLACALLVFGGATHVFRPTGDWYLRDAVLSDLVNSGFPTVYRVNGVDYLLRAPLGMYVLPALFGQFAGLAGAHVAMLAQNTLLLGAIFYVLLSLGRGWANLAILLGFAGAGIIVRIAAFLATGKVSEFNPGRDTMDSWNGIFQYSGSITQIFWVPNHMLPGWMLAILLLAGARREVDVGTIGVAVALLMFWSPLAIVPAVPAIAFFLFRAPREVLLARRTWAGMIAALLCVPVLLYLTAASDTVPRPDVFGFKEFWPSYFGFLPVQLAAAAVVWYLRARVPGEWLALLWVNVALLAILPFFPFGEFNDLVMRGSIPALVILAFLFGYALLNRDTPRRGADFAGYVLIALATTSGGYEFYRALAWKTYPINACTVMDISHATRRRVLQTNYIAPVDARLNALFGAMPPPAQVVTWAPPPAGELPEWPDTLTMATACWGAP
ncbi:MAG: hypothetical protein ACK5JM_09530 [Rhodoblastus sp.]